MTVMLFCYGSICEPDIYAYFSALGLTIVNVDLTSNELVYPSSELIKQISDELVKESPIIVFTFNFFPILAELCHIHNVIYLCWSVDCPLLELFDKAIQYPTNRIFLFDKAQYDYFYPYNPNCIYYLPLGANIDRFDYAIQNITMQDRSTYSSDVSFIGSLYSEKSPINALSQLSSHALECIDAIIENSLKNNDYRIEEEKISDNLIVEFKKAGVLFPSGRLIKDLEKYVVANRYIGYHATSVDRIQTLNQLAKHFRVDLYTGSDAIPLKNVCVHSPVSTLYDMPKVFHLSKINLNMTMKTIKTGIPLRVFDIMGCRGFLITNYQSEIPELFEIGKDLETYSSLEELVDKCDYYLQHEEVRQKIALQGYQKVCTYHTYPHRLNEMVKVVFSSLQKENKVVWI